MTLIKERHNSDNYWQHIYFAHNFFLVLFNYNFFEKEMIEAKEEEKEIYKIIQSLRIEDMS